MPLPENAVKEHLSRSFLRLAATHSGFIVWGSDADFGVDLTVKKVDTVEENGRILVRETGFGVDVQIKATCERNIRLVRGELTYDLDARTYNNLVARSHTLHTIPFVLAVFVLPDEPTDWLTFVPSEVTLRRCGYLWRPSAMDVTVPNTGSKAIRLANADRIDGMTLERLFREYTA